MSVGPAVKSEKTKVWVYLESFMSQPAEAQEQTATQDSNVTFVEDQEEGLYPVVPLSRHHIFFQFLMKSQRVLSSLC